MAGRGDNSRPAAKGGTDSEPLKRAVGGAMRAISGDRELEVGFSQDRPALTGHRARLPDLPKKPTRADISITRGIGDSMALRQACHDLKLHSRLAPEGPQARAVYDAVEQARVECIGALAMDGVADNLSAMIEDKLQKAKLSNVTDRADAPLEEALALMVHEKLTGRPIPRSGENLVALDRKSVV